jgi:amino acid adenylation domain-containing protein
MTDFAEKLTQLSHKQLMLLALQLNERLEQSQKSEPIAVIGMACRFPGADSPEEYWQLLDEGRDATREVPADRWDMDAFYDPDPKVPGKIATRRGGYLDDVAGFDAGLFGISPREALSMDPQQRLMLETSWQALERAGLAPEGLTDADVGVFLGLCNSDYFLRVAGRGLDTLDNYLASGNAPSVAAGRVSYSLGFSGPAITVDTACSASLVAVQMACRSLRAKESRVALAAGVNVICAPETAVSLSRGGMLAPDGRCRPFDASAGGFARGEGCGVLVLKRLGDAVAGKDQILAVIRGAAVNQDGRSGGLTVPSGPAQQAVIAAALADAGLKPADIDYVEAHGSGTSLGDPIEIGALAAAYGPGRVSPLLVGSVKSNIAHLESAAGIAGIMKAILALRAGRLPKSLHFQTPNPHIPWDELPVEVVAEGRAWPQRDAPRRAGVSSFGFSGTNAHVIVEEAPAKQPAAAPNVERFQHVIPLSAQGEGALKRIAGNFAAALRTGAVSIADTAHTAGVGRSHMVERAAVVAADADEAAAALQALADGAEHPRLHRGKASLARATDVVFMFSGQGGQHPGMAKNLYAGAPVFRAELDRCSALLGLDDQGRSLLDVMLAPGDDEAIHGTAWTQPALFALQHSLVALWASWGVKPAAVIGHSLGEYAAACAAGAMSLEDGLKLVAVRGKLCAALPPGAMAAIYAPLPEVEAEVAPRAARLSIAAVNGPESIVISGEKADLEAVVAAFDARDIRTQHLKISMAAHSPLVSSALASLHAAAAEVIGHAPSVPVAWNLTGGMPLPGNGAPDANYWCRHLAEPVRFAEGLAELRRQNFDAFLEIGPHPTLAALVQSLVPNGARVIHSLRRDADDLIGMSDALARLYVSGARIDWAGVGAPYGPCRVQLPTYAFEHRRYWVDGPARGASFERAPEAGRQKTQIYRRGGWKEIKPSSGEGFGSCLVVGPAAGVGPAFADALTAAGVVAAFEPVEDETRFDAVVSEVTTPPAWVIECGLADAEGDLDAPSRAANAYRRALKFAQAMAKSWPSVGLGFLTMGAQVVEPGDPCDPAQMAVLGLTRTIEAERPRTPILRLDLDPWSPAAATEAAEAFLALSGKESEAAIRHGAIFAQRLEMPAPLPMRDSAQRQVLRIGDESGLDNPRLISERRRAPRHGEVEVEVRAVGLNRRNALNGKAGSPATDVAGVVAAVGDGVTTIAVGDPVIAFASDSTATHAVASASLTAKIPAGVDFADAAAAADTCLTAAPGLAASGRLNLDEEILRGAVNIGGVLTRTLEDLATGRTAPLPVQAFDLKDGAAAFHFMANARPAGPTLLMPSRTPAVSADGAYLVTGGLGGLGLATARWLADHGAGEIWLIARSEPSAEQNAAVAALPRGSRVHIVRCDVGNAAALEAVIGKILAGKHAFRGVFHAAGTFDDTTLDYAKIAAAKSDAAWRLSELTWGARLDFFVLFSSCSSAFGSPGHASYSASNAFLDGLAAWRRAHGKVATSIAWGAWGEVGMAARLDDRTRARWVQAGLGLMSPRQALAAMETVLAADFDQAAILSLDLDRFLHGANRHVLKLFEDVAHVREDDVSDRSKQEAALTSDDPLESVVHVGGDASSDRNEQEAMFSSDDPARRRAAVAAFVHKETARVLGFLPASLDENAPLLELGLDSFMAVQLRNVVATRLGLDVSLKRLLEGATAAELAAELSQAVDASAPAASEAEWEEGVLYGRGTVRDCPVSPAVGDRSGMPLDGREQARSGEALVARLEARGVRLWFEGERLCFRARKGSLDAGDEAALSEHRDAVIATLRISAAETVIPATAGQQMHWFNHQMQPEHADYNIGLAIRISSPVDFEALTGALQAVTDRHPALRSTFAWDESGPVQKIAGWKPVALVQHDIRGVGEVDLRRLVEAAVRGPFDLTEGPLFRATLHTRDDDDHVLTLVAHHIVFDGGSMFKVLTELRALYAEAIGQAPAKLPPAGDNPAAFAAWHRDLLAGPEGARMEAYWAEVMGNLGSRVMLAGDRPRGAEPIRQAMLGADLSPELIENVRRAATVHGVTPFVLYLAAYQAVLQRWTGADDVIVGTPAFYGRAHPDFTDAVGDFVNILPLRARVTQQTTLADMVVQGRAALHGALEAQALPFPRIREIVQPGRVAGRTPLVSAMITLQRFDEMRELAGLFSPVAGAEPFDFASLKVLPYPLSWLPNPFDLQLQLMEVGDSVSAYWGFDAAVFDPITIEQFRNDFIGTLLAISATPEKTVAALGVSRVSQAETGAALLERLAKYDIHCSLDGENLKVNAPKGALDDAIRAEMRANRDGLLVALRRRAEADAATGGIPRLAESRRPELSFAQRRLWFLDQMDPGSVRYNIGGGVRLTGAIDTEVLRQALEDVFARHEAFRTRIATEDGVAQVEILERSRIPIEVSDLSSTLQDERDAVASAACSALMGASFDLASGILAGARIIEFAPDDHVLALSVHHIVSDGWSMAIIFRDVRTAYDARISGRAPQLTPPALRYVDFAAWEQDRAAADGFDKSSAYWRRALAGAPALLDLPSDHPRPPNGSIRGARTRAFIDEDLIDRLEATARTHGATLFMALVGAWQTLLSRLSGQDDVVIGTTVANRGNVALEEVVGFLVNNVPLRGDLGGSPSFTELLTRTKRAVLGAFEHADLPFEALVEAVSPERTAAHAPIFQTLLTLLNFQMDSVGPGGSSVDPVELDVRAARFDLVLDLARMTIGPKAGHMVAGYEYAADLFDEATILQWHAAFVRLLEAACAAPERSLAEVSLISSAEARAFYARVNDTALEHDRSRPTHALLEAAAQRHADEVAIVAADGQLTYGEFETRTNQLANLLVSRGVKSGSRVAVCLERGVDLPIALAATWKAGAAYVPLDPGHPAQRIGYVLEDANVACALTTSAFAPIFEGAAAPLIQLDVDGAAIAAASTFATGVEVGPKELAYVIYTSGSTGQPKGVEVEHRNLVAFLEAMKREPGLRAGDTLMAVTTPSFDIAGLEFWLPLSVGGRVLIASRQDTLDGKRLIGLLEKHGVAMLQATPATWRLMRESGWVGKPDLTALCGGEAMPPDLARWLAPRVSALWNMYGPTETTIWSTLYRVRGDEGVIPIGGPIANTRIYVIDPSGAPSPIGAPGELMIAGEGVARGYRNRPELNAEKFVEIAPTTTPERAFKTGDLVRWRSDGRLEFLGRGDGQVKIRGFRVELGEIEARLATLPAVESVVVAAREDTPGEKRLVAYVVQAPGATFHETEARVALRGTLPDYMTPSAYVQLDRLPLSPNGKVDRKALPAPSASASLVPDPADALMTPAQRNVAALWREILHLDRVGLYQNFFDLGGHSLLLVKLQVALKASFGQEITIVELFQRTTVAAQAERCASPAPSCADDAVARARAAARRTALSRADLRRLA